MAVPSQGRDAAAFRVSRDVRPPVYDPSWRDDVKALHRHDMQEIWDPRIAPQIWNQYHNQLDIYLGIAEGAGALDILDVGCAQGTLALLLAERGHRVWAMDIRQQFLDYAASRYERGEIHFICGNAMEAEPGHHFDLIFANQVVEHLVTPFEFVKRLAGWLKPHGRLVLTTPNAVYVKNSLPTFTELGDSSQYEHLQFSADGDGHFFAYLDHELADIMRAAGLSDIRTAYFETPWVSGHMKIRYLHSFVPSAILRLADRMMLRIPALAKRFSHQLLIEGRRI